MRNSQVNIAVSSFSDRGHTLCVCVCVLKVLNPNSQVLALNKNTSRKTILYVTVGRGNMRCFFNLSHPFVHLSLHVFFQVPLRYERKSSCCYEYYHYHLLASIQTALTLPRAGPHRPSAPARRVPNRSGSTAQPPGKSDRDMEMLFPNLTRQEK